MKYLFNRKALAFTLIGILILAISFFLLRNWYFDTSIKKVQQKLQHQLHLNLAIHKYSFSGIKQLAIEDFIVSNRDADTLLLFDSIHVQLKLRDLLKRNVRFKRVYIHNLKIALTHADLKLFLHSEMRDTLKSNPSETIDYAFLVNKMSTKLFGAIPSEIIADNLMVTFHSQKGPVNLFCPSIILKQKHLTGNIFLYNDARDKTEYLFSGLIDQPNNAFEFEFCRNLLLTHANPFKEPVLGMGVQTDTLKVGFLMHTPKKGLVTFSGQFKTQGLTLIHEKLAPKPVHINSASIQFNSAVTKNTLEIDSSSVISVNQISFSPYLIFRNTVNKELELKIIEKEYESATLFQSLPEGLFTNIRDIKSKGSVNYRFGFKVNLDNPDDIELESDLKSRNFQIEQFGATNLTQLNNTFTFEVMENNQPVRSIFVGPENPNFTSINDISDFLKYSVITTEDGGFFYHKGFDLESIKHSISDDIKKGRFARGGSTITMQLVKNVFLNKNKTISRKMEELLMVWMIENLNLSTKERMFEVYLNIIEWGPGIYGIKEASEYYFNKKPSKLTLNESIYLASIIPSPKNFRFTFNKEGNLRDYYREYYRFTSETMLSRGWITTNDTVGLIPNVVLTGDAKNYLVKTDSLKIDSLPIPDLMLNTAETGDQQP